MLACPSKLAIESSDTDIRDTQVTCVGFANGAVSAKSPVCEADIRADRLDALVVASGAV